jgi:hypothetical protein
MSIIFNKNAVQENKNSVNKDFKVGEVYFAVDGAEEKHSEKLGQFILLKLSISNFEGQTAKITACLFFTDNMLWRVKQFCNCVGEDKLFEKGEISVEAFAGLEGRALVDRNQDYINVKKFLPKILTIKKPLPVETNNKAMDDDLPF